MPANTTKKNETERPDPYAGRYKVDGRTFVWITEDGDEIALPLRIKLKVIRAIGATGDVLNTKEMFDVIEALIPGQAEAVDELDVNDFQAMFVTWQKTYNSLSGASLGESQGSPT